MDYLCSSLAKLQFILVQNIRWNQTQKSLRQLFQVTQKLITDLTEMSGITTIDWRQLMWRETTLLTDTTVQFTTAEIYVFSDPVQCLGSINIKPIRAC